MLSGIVFLAGQIVVIVIELIATIYGMYQYKVNGDLDWIDRTALTSGLAISLSIYVAKDIFDRSGTKDKVISMLPGAEDALDTMEDFT